MSDDNTPRVVITIPDKRRGELEELRRVMDKEIEAAAIIAKYKRTTYLEYIKAGFTSAQAMELIK